MQRGLALVLLVAWTVTGFLIGRSTAPSGPMTVAQFEAAIANQTKIERAIAENERAIARIGWQEFNRAYTQLHAVCPEFFTQMASHSQSNVMPLANESDRLRYNRCAEAASLKR